MLVDLARELEGAKFEALDPQLDRIAIWISRGQRDLLRVDVLDILAGQKDRVGYYLARRL